MGYFKDTNGLVGEIVQLARQYDLKSTVSSDGAETIITVSDNLGNQILIDLDSFDVTREIFAQYIHESDLTILADEIEEKFDNEVYQERVFWEQEASRYLSQGEEDRAFYNQQLL